MSWVALKYSKWSFPETVSLDFMTTQQEAVKKHQLLGREEYSRNEGWRDGA